MEHPTEREWREAKERYPVGAILTVLVESIVPFGIFVRLPEVLAPGVLKAPAFPSRSAFERRADDHPIGSSVSVRVLGFAEGRLQLDLELAEPR